jgi:hypothetical protein
MSEGSNSSSSGGIGLGGLVFLVFLILKLCEIGVVATWSWWWVTAPLWIPLGIVFGVFAIAGIVAVIGGAVNRRRSLRRLYR